MTDQDQAVAESTPAHQTHGRRRLLIGAGVAAMLAGAGAAWWQTTRPQDPSGVAPDPGFWATQWETPQGEKLLMETFKGRPLLVNFWATWCPPCVEELPLIDAFFDENKAKGWQVLGLAVDRLAPVQSFLKHSPVDFPVAMAGANGTEVARSLGNLSGGLPFSVVFDSSGMIVHRKLGQIKQADLDLWLRLK
jgi:thiol-disulfide isomerase/thioredoxin